MLATILPSPGTLHKAPFSHKEMERLLCLLLRESGQETHQVELALVSDGEMELLNQEATGMEGPTNILSFPAENTEDIPTMASQPSCGNNAPPFLGSLALSVDTLRREAFLYQQPLEEHCIRLLAHGFAHLLGYDHSPEMDAVSERFEQALLAPLQQ